MTPCLLFLCPEYLEGEGVFYIVSPKDIVLARKRDIDDHITWLMENEKFEVNRNFGYIQAGGDKVRYHLMNPLATAPQCITFYLLIDMLVMQQMAGAGQQPMC